MGSGDIQEARAVLLERYQRGLSMLTEAQHAAHRFGVDVFLLVLDTQLDPQRGPLEELLQQRVRTQDSVVTE